MMGTVENDEPIPMVTSRPTSSMAKEAQPLWSPSTVPTVWTNESTPWVAFITDEKPEALIMMKPISDIILTPWVKAS